MHHIFIDESGEFGQKPGSSKYFLIAVLCTENLKALEKRLWKQKAILYAQGWPQSLEIKGTSLWRSPNSPEVPRVISDRRVEILSEILAAICASPIKVHYCVAKKAQLTDRLRNADYGIAYNYFCGTLLCRAYRKKFFGGPIEMVIDQRSKETHHKMKFDGYVETRLFDECDHCDHLSITHAESHDVLGLQAVDFLSWSLFRHYEHGDGQFKKIIQPVVGHRDDWYTWKR